MKTKKKPPVKARSKLKPKFKKRGAPGAASKERKALDALYKTYNRPAAGDDDDDS
jgi:hypothetical protein